MPLRIVNIGRADKGDGDPIRVAFDKINQNFQEFNATINNLTFEVNSISTESSLSFDFGSIAGTKVVTTPIELLFYTADIDMGFITNPAPVLYDAGLIG